MDSFSSAMMLKLSWFQKQIVLNAIFIEPSVHNSTNSWEVPVTL